MKSMIVAAIILVLTVALVMVSRHAKRNAEELVQTLGALLDFCESWIKVEVEDRCLPTSR